MIYCNTPTIHPNRVIHPQNPRNIFGEWALRWKSYTGIYTYFKKYQYKGGLPGLGGLKTSNPTAPSRPGKIRENAGISPGPYNDFQTRHFSSTQMHRSASRFGPVTFTHSATLEDPAIGKSSPRTCSRSLQCTRSLTRARGAEDKFFKIKSTPRVHSPMVRFYSPDFGPGVAHTPVKPWFGGFFTPQSTPYGGTNGDFR